MSVFVDTSAWFAAAHTRDRRNGRAKELLATPETLVTSDHVLIETWRLLHHFVSVDAAERFWEGLRGGVATVETTTAADLDAAWEIGTAFRDQDFSVVDRTSFALMVRLGVSRVISFDRDFAVFRYGSRRQTAFTVLR